MVGLISSGSEHYWDDADFDRLQNGLACARCGALVAFGEHRVKAHLAFHERVGDGR